MSVGRKRIPDEVAQAARAARAVAVYVARPRVIPRSRSRSARPSYVTSAGTADPSPRGSGWTT